MKRLLTFLTLLTVFIGVSWAAETVFYTLDGTATGGNQNYDSYSDITQSSMSWKVMANTTMNPWRIGGKKSTTNNGDGADRPIYNTTPMGSAITMVSISVGSATSITVKSLKLNVYSDASMTNELDEVTATFADNSTIDIRPTSGTEWAANSYYKITFNVAVSQTSNKFVELNSISFYKNEGGTVTPTVQTPVIAINPSSGPYHVGDNVTASITCGTDGASIQYQINDGSWTNYTAGSNITIPTTTAGTVTIKAKATKADYNDSGEATQTITITPAATTFNHLADVNSNECTTGTEFTFTAQTVVLAKNGKNMYIVMPDNSAGSLIYDATSNWPNTYVYGKVINSDWSGTKAVYRDKPEVTNPSNFELAGTEVEVTPIVITSDADLTKDNFGRYAVIKNVQVAANGSVTGLTTYNQFGLSFTNFVAGKYDVYGVIGWDNGGGDGTGSGQFMPTEFVEHEAAYTITVNQPSEGGSISADAETADEGEEITLTATPDTGYEFASWIVKDADDNDVAVTGNKFTMPASNVTVTATFSKIKYAVAVNVTPANSGEVWVLGGCTVENNVSVSTIGTTVTVKLHTYGGYQVDGILVKDASDNEIATSLTNTEDDGNTYTFVMPASAVTVTGKFRTYVPDVYYLDGELSHWDNGTVMTYDSENEVYRLRVIISDGDTGFFRFRAGNETYASGAEGEYWGLTGTTEGESTIIYKGSTKRFRVPAGIYDIVIGKLYSNGGFHANTSFTITKVEPTLTFYPAAGQVPSGTEVYVSSDLYELLSAVNSSITENDVTNMVKTDGDYAAIVTLDGAATVTGRAKYGHIEVTATADYTISQVNTSTQYQLIKNEDALEHGKKYLVVGTYSTGNPFVVMGAVSGNRLGGVTAVPENEIITATTDMRIVTLEQVGNNWAFKTDDGYAYTGTSNGYGSYVEQSQPATITFKEVAEGSPATGELTINFVNNTSKPYLNVNRFGNSGSYFYEFGGYGSALNTSHLYLYRQVEGAIQVGKPEINPGTGRYTSAQTVTITCPNSEATIWYKYGNMTDYAEYTAPLTISENTTLTAYATMEDCTDSEIASATYTFVAPEENGFKLVTSEQKLVPGYEYIMVINNEFNKAFGAIDNANAEAGSETTFTITDDHSLVILDEGSNVNILTLGTVVKDGSTYYTFKQKNGKYIYVMPTGSQIKDDDVNSSYTNEFTISINGGSNNDNHYATIQGGGNQQILYRTYGVFRHYAIANANNYPEYRKVMLYYREAEVVEEPTEATLADIEAPANDENVNTKYAITDPYLVAVVSRDVVDGDQSYVYVWCKDNKKVVTPITVPEGAVDFMRNNGAQIDDQSNWVVLRFDGTDSNAHGLVGYQVTNIVGTYVDATNYMIDVESYDKGEEDPYTPNVYCVANFNPTYIANGGIANQPNDDKNYFFMPPKVQEYCKITFAEWNGTTFSVPEASGFEGTLSLGWDYNESANGNPLTQLQVETYLNEANVINPETGKYPAYHFNAIVQRPTTGTGAKGAISGGSIVQPMNLEGSENSIPTAISTILAGNGEVKSVKYVNVAGIVSDVPFQGVNIVVTEYTDGSRTTTKMLKK